MVNFKELLEKSATEASNLPSFPQKGQTYNIDAKNPDFSSYEDWVEQENQWHKMVKKKQTLYRINTKEGKLRVSPNQIQQLKEVLANVTITEETEYIAVQATEGANGVLFALA